MRRIYESSKIEFQVVFVSSIGSYVYYINEKNYKDIDKIYKIAYDEISKDEGAPVGEIWIDDIEAEGFKKADKIDWKEILTDKKGILNPEMFEKVFEDENFVLKYQFCILEGEDIEDIDLEDIYVFDAKRSNFKEGNFHKKYPDDWLDEMSQELYPDLYKSLEKVNGDSYFDWARLFSDSEANGNFDSEIIGDYFVWK